MNDTPEEAEMMESVENRPWEWVSVRTGLPVADSNGEWYDPAAALDGLWDEIAAQKRMLEVQSEDGIPETQAEGLPQDEP